MKRTTPQLQLPTTRGHRAVTLVELMAAIAISLVFMGSVVTAYLQITSAADEAEARVRAHTRARIATDMIARDLRSVLRDPTLFEQVFIITDGPRTLGDRVDNDGDGLVDEDPIDGFDDDNDWTASDDRHARIGAYRERADYVGIPDLGDFSVDEDYTFATDEITVRVPSDNSGNPAREITYRIDSFNGISNVLVREVVESPGSINETTTVEPVVFDVVSLDLLAYSPNSDVTNPPGLATPAPYWTSEWDAAAVDPALVHAVGQPAGTTPFEFPSAVYVGVTVSAEARPLSENETWPLGSGSLETVQLSTVAALKPTVGDPAYAILIRPDF